MEEKIIDKDFTQSYWLALQFVRTMKNKPNRGVPWASHGITVLYRKIPKTSPSKYKPPKTRNAKNAPALIFGILRYVEYTEKRTKETETKALKKMKNVKRR